jgi:hypothetical protein
MNIPYEPPGDNDDGELPFRFWSAFCINGGSTSKIFQVNQLLTEKPDVSICSKYY